MPLPADVVPFHNTEHDSNLSGYSYVAVHMKEDPTGKLGKIQISIPRLCGHINRICLDCADEWKDYEIFWDRTEGGRRLKVQLDAR